MSDELSPLARFGAMVAAERAYRGWSMRDLCAKAGLPAAPSRVKDIEDGKGTSLAIAVKIASALRLSLDPLLTAPWCARCGDEAPPGFICSTCGRRGRDPAP